MSNRGTITIEIPITEMGQISIALDHYLLSHGHYAELNPSEWKDLQQKWDRLYRGTHQALDAGARSIQGI